MSREPGLLVLAAILGLAGCAQFGGDKTARHRTECDGSRPCLVKVRVNDCRVTVAEELVVGDRGVSKPIIWQIDARDAYRFSTDGIAIFENSGKAVRAGDFDHPTPAGKVFVWNDRHTRAGDYPYTVNVVSLGPNPQACPPHDPFIRNQ